MVSSSFILSSVVLALASRTLATAVPRNPPPNQQLCSQVQTLAVEINRSIAVQQQALAAAQDLAGQLTHPIDQARYTASKNTLLGHINNGLGMTQTNQRNAPPGNPSIAGLGAVVGSLQAEQGMANSLKGNPGDNAVMQKLMADINGAIAKNQENARQATQGC